MILKETVVYVEVVKEKGHILPIYNPNVGHYDNKYIIKKEGYLFTKEELVVLLGSVCDSSNHYSNGYNIWNMDKEEFINSLFNTEEDGK